MQKKLFLSSLICTVLALSVLNSVSEAALTAAEDASIQTICTRVRMQQQPLDGTNHNPLTIVRRAHFSLFRTYVSDHMAMNYVQGNITGLNNIPASRHTLQCSGCKSEWQALYHVGQQAGMLDGVRNIKFQEVMNRANAILTQ